MAVHSKPIKGGGGSLARMDGHWPCFRCHLFLLGVMGMEMLSYQPVIMIKLIE